MNRNWIIRALLGFSAAMLCTMALSSPVKADTVLDLNIPGIGSQIPIQSFSFGTMELTVFRAVDLFSAGFFADTVNGTLVPTASLDTYDSSVSLTDPVSSFVMTGVQFTSIQHSGDFAHPVESITMTFATGTEVSNVAEPSSLVLLGAGLPSVFGSWRRRANS